MDKQKQAIRQVLDTLERLPPLVRGVKEIVHSITALREALAEQAEQRSDSEQMEPVAHPRGLISRLQSFHDRLCADARSAVMFEGDAEEIAEAIKTLKRYSASFVQPVSQEPVAIKQLPDPYDERDGVWFDAEGLQRLRELPVGTKLYAAPVRTKDLTVSELDAIIEKHYDDEMDLKAMILDGIAADRKLNGVEK